MLFSVVLYMYVTYSVFVSFFAVKVVMAFIIFIKFAYITVCYFSAEARTLEMFLMT